MAKMCRYISMCMSIYMYLKVRQRVCFYFNVFSHHQYLIPFFTYPRHHHRHRVLLYPSPFFVCNFSDLSFIFLQSVFLYLSLTLTISISLSLWAVPLSNYLSEKSNTPPRGLNGFCKALTIYINFSRLSFASKTWRVRKNKTAWIRNRTWKKICRKIIFSRNEQPIWQSLSCSMGPKVKRLIKDIFDDT